MLFVAGEAGIGKSRLAREAIAAARHQSFSVLSGRATQAHSTVAFRPVTEALSSYFRDEGPPDMAELEPFRPLLARLVPEWRRDDSRAPDDSIVLLAEAAARLSPQVHINLHTIGLTHDTLGHLKGILQASPGGSSVYLHLLFPDEREVILLSEDRLQVVPSEVLVQDIESLFGQEVVHFE